MVSLAVIYILCLTLFGFIGYLRGWQKEVLAMAGLVGSIALLSVFGTNLVALSGGMSTPDPASLAPPGDAIVTVEEIQYASVAPTPQEFWPQFLLHTIIAFFSYQVVARIASPTSGGRLGDRLRSGLESKITGALFGVLNGYLLTGTVWSFLEYKLTSEGYMQLAPGLPYGFSETLLTRYSVDSVFSATLAQYLPMHFDGTLWLILFFLVFFIVIVALI